MNRGRWRVVFMVAVRSTFDGARIGWRYPATMRVSSLSAARRLRGSWLALVPGAAARITRWRRR